MGSYARDRRESTMINWADPDRKWFCSELVAAAYKCLGLLPEEVPSAHYVPGSFASESLKLHRKATLGSCIGVVFAEDVLSAK